jgi:hypothetical protein
MRAVLPSRFEYIVLFTCFSMSVTLFPRVASCPPIGLVLLLPQTDEFIEFISADLLSALLAIHSLQPVILLRMAVAANMALNALARADIECVGHTAPLLLALQRHYGVARTRGSDRGDDESDRVHTASPLSLAPLCAAFDICFALAVGAPFSLDAAMRAAVANHAGHAILTIRPIDSERVRVWVCGCVGVGVRLCMRVLGVVAY